MSRPVTGIIVREVSGIIYVRHWKRVRQRRSLIVRLFGIHIVRHGGRGCRPYVVVGHRLAGLWLPISYRTIVPGVRFVFPSDDGGVVCLVASFRLVLRRNHVVGEYCRNGRFRDPVWWCAFAIVRK